MKERKSQEDACTTRIMAALTDAAVAAGEWTAHATGGWAAHAAVHTPHGTSHTGTKVSNTSGNSGSFGFFFCFNSSQFIATDLDRK